MNRATQFVVALAIASVPTMALAAVSPAVGKALNAAKGGNAGALAQARAAATTAEERRAVSQMAAYVYTRGGQYGRAAQELESIGAPASQLAPLYYRAGNCTKATQLANKSGMRTIVAQCQLKQGNYKGAVSTYQALVKSNPSNRSYLENLAGAQYRSGDKDAYLATVQRLIRIDPSPARWNALLLDLKKESMSREAKLALFQLMRETNNIRRPEDYQEFAKLAIVSGQPGVAKRALDEARAANIIAPSDQMTVGLLNAAAQRTAEAQKNFGRLPKTPDGRFQAGNVLMGAGNYPAAASAYGQAVAGNVSNKDQALLLQGIAHVRAGNKGAARTALKAVSEDGAYKDVATLWDLYASTKA